MSIPPLSNFRHGSVGGSIERPILAPPVSNSPKPEGQSASVSPLVGRVLITEGIDRGAFPFNPASPPPHPNTAEPHMSQRQAEDIMRATGFQVPTRQQLNRDHTIAMIAAQGAWSQGYGFAGELLAHYLLGTGSSVVAPLRRAGRIMPLWGAGASDVDHVARSASTEQVLSAVRRYFASHPRVTELSASTAWRPFRARDADPERALHDFHLRVQGVFVAQRDASGKVTSIEGRLQMVGHDFYDFSMNGWHLDVPFLGKVKREHLWLMQYSGLAKGFPVWLKGPVERYKIQP